MCGPERAFLKPKGKEYQPSYSRECPSAVAGRPCSQLVRQQAALHMWRSTTMFPSVVTSVAGSNGRAPNRTRYSLPQSGCMSLGALAGRTLDHLRSMHADHTSHPERDGINRSRRTDRVGARSRCDRRSLPVGNQESIASRRGFGWQRQRVARTEGGVDVAPYARARAHLHVTWHRPVAFAKADPGARGTAAPGN